MLSIRKIEAFGRTYRHLNRYRQILGVFIKYGFGDLIERLKIDQYIEIGLQMLYPRRGAGQYQAYRHTRAERIRMALEELGPTYVKLGQILSTRADLITEKYAREFARLQDSVPPFPYEDVRRIIERELEDRIENIFETFETPPLASASLGQVHRATLNNGELVAVKVQRPGIRSIMEIDLEIMLHLAMLMERNIEEVSVHRPVRIVEEFTRILEYELDYKHEAANTERFHRQLLHDPTIYIPIVFNDFSTDRVLTMEFIEGIKVSDHRALERAGINKKKVVERGANLLFRQVFDFGFFHADPHPGNIRVLSKNVICLLDFGMMGSIDKYTRGDFVDLIYGAVRQDETGTVRVLLKLTEWDEEPDIRQLERDVSDILGLYLNRPLKDVEFSGLMRQILELTGRYHLRLPADIFLMMKAFSTIESVARELYPEFDLASYAAPYVKREKMQRMHPRRLAENAYNLSGELFHFLNQFPKDTLELLRMAKRQRLSIRFEHSGLEEMIETLDRTSNKLAIAIIVAALIIGSSIVIIAKIPPLFYGISLLGIMVFLAAGVMGIWLVVSIIRTKRL